jgi:hypothetical protein
VRHRVAAGRILGAVPLFLGLAVLAGCPLSSDTPLSDPAAAQPDPGLVGTWKSTDPETGEVNEIKILAFNEHEMVAVAPESDAGKVSAMRLFPTRIGTETFLNIQELGSGDHGWVFARYRIDNDRLRMTIVDDELFRDRRFASSDELRAFVARNLGDPRLYASNGDTPTEMNLDRVPEPSGAPGPKS